MTYCVQFQNYGKNLPWHSVDAIGTHDLWTGTRNEAIDRINKMRSNWRRKFRIRLETP